MAQTGKQVATEISEEEKRFRRNVIERLDRIESIFLPFAAAFRSKESIAHLHLALLLGDMEPGKDTPVSQYAGDTVAKQPEAETDLPAFETEIGLQERLIEMEGDIAAVYAAARERGEAAGAALARDPDLISAADFAERLRITKAAIHQKRKKGEVLGVSFGPQKYWFPTWQIDANGRLLDGLKEVHDAFYGDTFAVYRFLKMKHPELDGRTGIETLASGGLMLILTTIRGLWDGVPA